MQSFNTEMALIEITKELKINNFLKMYELGIITYEVLKRGINDIYNVSIQGIEKEDLDAVNKC